MVNHCANPQCCKPFHYLRDGRVYLFNMSKPIAIGDQARARMELSGSVAHAAKAMYWNRCKTAPYALYAAQAVPCSNSTSGVAPHFGR